MKKKSVGFYSSLYKLNEKSVNLSNQKITKNPKISQKSVKDEENSDLINLEQSVTMDLAMHTSEIGQLS